jgi:uncharacterized protein with GYD domain
MGVYLMLSKLTEKGRKVVRENPEKIREVNEKVERMGVKILSQYALFGPYDFVNILKAENDEVIMKLAIEVTAGGKLEVLTLPAVHVDTFIESLKE